MSLKLSEAYDYGKSVLKKNNIESYMLDAKLLLMEVTGFNKIYLITEPNYIIEENIFCRYKELINKRAEKKPVQYLINKCEFMGHDFYVDENVLIPRPDTEILVERCIDYLQTGEYKKILEIGTGSGCIAVSLAKRFDFEFTAVDISEKALAVAKKNAQANRVSDKIEFIKSDLMSGLKNHEFDMIISNPPYIKTEIINTLDSCVKDYEPHLALDGGGDGLYFYDKIVGNAPGFLRKGGLLMFEIGFDQGENLQNIFESNDIIFLELLKDYQGLDRVVTGKVRNDV